MLKLALEEGERSGGVLLAWWDGSGAAHVLAQDGSALLMERATGPASLADMALAGRDDEACRVLCALAAKLHAPRSKPWPDLIPLTEWFRALEPVAVQHGGVLARAADAARLLLTSPREVGVLHGDLHHGNVLDFVGRGWLAIDPKGLVGERGFEFAVLFTNPDLADPTQPLATDLRQFQHRLEVVTEAARLERGRLLLCGSDRSGLVGCLVPG